MTEVLPYMGIYMTEELSDAERAELEAKRLEETIKYAPVVSGGDAGETDEPADNGNGSNGNRPPWMDFEKDPVTGYLIDPETGAFLDPETGDAIEGDYPAITE